eukprot:1251216-Pyramimonas_sp.AAC.1
MDNDPPAPHLRTAQRGDQTTSITGGAQLEHSAGRRRCFRSSAPRPGAPGAQREPARRSPDLA